MKRFIGILQFLTRIPINIDIGFDEDFHKSIVYFPLVGFILGIIHFIIGNISLNLFNLYITSVIVLMSDVILTGGLHLDGLCDTFDGIYSYRDKDRILEIMKDSRLGTNAMLAVMFLVLIKLGFIYSVLNHNMLWVLIFMPIFGRLALVHASYKTTTPREKGMGNLFIGKATKSIVATALIYTIVLVSLISILIFKLTIIDLIKNLVFIGVNYVFTKLFIKSIYKKIDGITGDILGCICELSQVIYLGFIYIMFSLK